jgi:hypothetical protein
MEKQCSAGKECSKMYQKNKKTLCVNCAHRHDRSDLAKMDLATPEISYETVYVKSGNRNF